MRRSVFKLSVLSAVIAAVLLGLVGITGCNSSNQGKPQVAAGDDVLIATINDGHRMDAVQWIKGVLRESGIHSTIEGSLTYSVVVAQTNASRARTVLRQAMDERHLQMSNESYIVEIR